MKNQSITGVIFRTKNFLRESNNYQNYVEGKIIIDSILSNLYPSLIGKGYINTHISPLKRKKIMNNDKKFILPEGGEKSILENNISKNIFQRNDLNINNNELFLPQLKCSNSMKNINEHKEKNVIELFNKKFNLKKKLRTDKSNLKSFRLNRNPEYLLFQQEFFNSTIRFFNLKYEQEVIFNKRQYYDKLIKKHLMKLKQSNNNENLTYYLEKELNDNKGNDIILKLYSLNIKFENIKEKKEYNVYIPFTLLPVFFCYEIITINDIRLIFTMIIKLNQNKSDLLFLDDTLLFKFLNKISIPINNFYFNDYKFYDKIIFPWYTKKVTYKVTITLPTLYFSLVDKNIKFEKIINYELLFYMFNKNFINWDFYVFNYLFSFKKFRNIIGKSLSYFDENPFNDLNLNLDSNLKVLSYENLKSNYYFFIATRDNNNEMYKIKPGSLILKVKLLDTFKYEYEHIEKIYFNLYQTKILSESIKKINKPKEFLKKFFNVSLYNNRDKLIFNFDFEKFNEININEFAEKMNKNKYYEKESRNNKSINKIDENDIYSMNFDIEIIQPYIEIYNKTIEGILYESGFITLNEEDSYNLFCLSSLMEWPKYIIEKVFPKSKIIAQSNLNRLKSEFFHSFGEIENNSSITKSLKTIKKPKNYKHSSSNLKKP